MVCVRYICFFYEENENNSSITRFRTERGRRKNDPPQRFFRLWGALVKGGENRLQDSEKNGDKELALKRNEFDGEKVVVAASDRSWKDFVSRVN